MSAAMAGPTSIRPNRSYTTLRDTTVTREVVETARETLVIG